MFKINSNNSTKEVNPDYLADIKLKDKTVRRTKSYPQEVVFELKGKLAKRYQLRENEQMTRMKPNGSIIITNKYEDKTQLLRRLMRYDSSCKLLKPKEYVDDLKGMIDTALKNYQ